MYGNSPGLKMIQRAMRRYLSQKHARQARRKLFEQRMKHAAPPRWGYSSYLRVKRFRPDLSWEDHVLMHNTEQFGAERALKGHKARRQSQTESDAGLFTDPPSLPSTPVVAESKPLQRHPRQSWLAGTIKKFKVSHGQRNAAAIQLQKVWRGHRARNRAKLRRQFLKTQQELAEDKKCVFC
jgi:IQ calmodulin-binding motif